MVAAVAYMVLRQKLAAMVAEDDAKAIDVTLSENSENNKIILEQLRNIPGVEYASFEFIETKLPKKLFRAQEYEVETDWRHCTVNVVSNEVRQAVLTEIEKLPVQSARARHSSAAADSETAKPAKSFLSVEFWYASENNQNTVEVIKLLPGVEDAEMTDSQHAKLTLANSQYADRLQRNLPSMLGVWSVKPISPEAP